MDSSLVQCNVLLLDSYMILINLLHSARASWLFLRANSLGMLYLVRSTLETHR